MTVSPLELILAFAGGFAIGLLYFLGLWLTLRFMQFARRPVMFILSSFIVRTAIAAGLFVWIGNGKLPRFGLALVGFVLARVIVIVFCAPPRNSPPDPEKGAG